MYVIKLDNPVTVEFSEVPQLPNQPSAETRKATVSSLTFCNAIDCPVAKRVSVSFFETRFPVVVWDGDDYDKVGNWTQEQLEAAVSAMIESDPGKIIKKALDFPPIMPEDQGEEELIVRQRISSAFLGGVAPVPAWFPVTTAQLPPTLQDNSSEEVSD